MLPKTIKSILDDPNHSVTENSQGFYWIFTLDNAAIVSGKLTPSQQRGYDVNVNKTALAKQVLNYYIEDEVSPLIALVQNYLAFNHWHSDMTTSSTGAVPR